MAYDFPASPVENQEYTPADGATYIFKAPQWLVKTVPITTDNGPIEAPLDGKQYGRQDAAWTQVLPNPTWSTLTGKPATFPPDAHTHAYGSLTGIPTTFPPESHTHAYSTLTGIPATFAPSAHGHAQSEITGLVTDLAGKAAAVHTHVQADVTGLVAALAAKEPTIVGGTTDKFWRGDKTWVAIPVADWSTLAGKPSTFPPNAHSHPISDVTSLQIALDGKAPTAHTHAQSDITGLATTLSTKAPLESPEFIGIPTTPGAAPGTMTDQIANLAFVGNSISGLAPKLSPVFIGTPEAPTPAPNNNTDQIVTGAYVTLAISELQYTYAKLASPMFSGTPGAPTAAPGTNDVQIANTVFVNSAIAAAAASGSYLPLTGGTLTGNLMMGANRINFGSALNIGAKQDNVAHPTYIAATGTLYLQTTRGTTGDAAVLFKSLTDATVAQIDGDNTAANFDQTIMTRRKADFRYAVASNYLPLTGGALTGSLVMSGTAPINPLIRFEELDQVDPIGRYAITAAAGNFNIQRALTANWATTADIIIYEHTNNSLMFATDVIFAGNIIGSTIFTGSPTIQSGTPTIRFKETDAVSPAGQYGFYGATNDFVFVRYATASFTGASTIWSYDDTTNAFSTHVLTKLAAATPYIVEVGAAGGAQISFMRTTSLNYLQVVAGTTLQVRNNAGTPVAWASVSSASGWVAGTCDIRLKENVTDIHYGLDTIMQLRAVEFDRLADGTHDLGLISQEVQPIVPEVIEESFNEDDGETYLFLRKDTLVPILIKALQEMYARLVMLEEKQAA